MTNGIKISGDVRGYNMDESLLALKSMTHERDRHIVGNDMWRKYNAATKTIRARIDELEGKRRVRWMTPA